MMESYDVLRLGLETLAYCRTSTDETPALTLYLHEIRVAVKPGLDYTEHRTTLERHGWRFDTLNHQPFFILAI